MLVVLFAACPSVAVAFAFDDDTDDDMVSPFEKAEARRVEAEKAAQRLEANKRRHELLVIRFYIESAKHRVDRALTGWHPPASSGQLLSTKVKVTVDANGKTTCKIVTGSGSAQEDKSVQECLDLLDHTALPPGLNSLDLFWTFICEGNLKSVECTDSPEANAYYTNLLGGTLSPKGGSLIVQRSATNDVEAKLLSAQSGVDLDTYMADLQGRIRRAWLPPKTNEPKRVIVVFKVHRGGEVSNLKLYFSSGIDDADQAALTAVENGAPYRPLPAGASDEVAIQFIFHYNAFNNIGLDDRSAVSAD